MDLRIRYSPFYACRSPCAQLGDCCFVIQHEQGHLKAHLLKKDGNVAACYFVLKQYAFRGIFTAAPRQPSASAARHLIME